MKVKKGDSVKILAGKDRGKQGPVERVLAKDRLVVVTGLNLIKKHTRPRPHAPHGGIATIPAPLPQSRVMVMCPRCQKPTRVGIVLDKEGTRHRQCKQCQETF
ncbi:50S ribosomal protein L24 [Candidatus Berkelbacteria bacterium]|nr:50S ribosomal protein L24 [Candidatus Berkelbacteria bacterium]